MNILFRADSSSSIGTGHIMRDLVLAKRDFKDDNIIFAVRNLEGNINHKIKEAGYKIEILKSNNIEELNQVIKKYSIDMIVIDHYGIDYNYEKKLSILNSKLSIMILDDTYERHHCDILLNHNIYADESKYKDLVPKHCEIRCGEKYTLIRDEFYKEKEIKREKIYDIFIAMGGVDSANITLQLLKLLPIDKKIAVVTTSGNKNIKDLKSFINKRKNIKLFIDFDKIAKLMNESNFGIITPSVISQQTLFMGVKFLAIQTADNQKEIAKYLKKKNILVLKKSEIKKINDIIFDK